MKTIPLRIGTADPIMLDERTADRLRIYAAKAQKLMPKDASSTAVHLLMLMIARDIEQQARQPANVVPFRRVDGDLPRGAA